ncbi:hypothetical protein [Streptomyces coerulescens]|uniref:Uncharacterized protein n=1 Tax=Streptomyces coerulescens TaxID=29304 RepID=A0ABW0CVK3_STRCD
MPKPPSTDAVPAIPDVLLVVGEPRTSEPLSALPRAEPALFAQGMPGMARRFAGLPVTPDGELLLSGNGEGTVLRLTPRAPL